MAGPGVETDAASSTAAADSTETASGSDLLDVVSRLRELGVELMRLLDLRVEQARVSVRTRYWRVVYLAWIAAVVLIATAVGLVKTANGLSGLLAHALEVTWAADLLVGVLILLSLIGWALALRRSIRRAGLKRLRTRFEPAPAEATRPAAEAGP